MRADSGAERARRAENRLPDRRTHRNRRSDGTRARRRGHARHESSYGSYRAEPEPALAQLAAELGTVLCETAGLLHDRNHSTATAGGFEPDLPSMIRPDRIAEIGRAHV